MKKLIVSLSMAALLVAPVFAFAATAMPTIPANFQTLPQDQQIPILQNIITYLVGRINAILAQKELPSLSSSSSFPPPNSLGYPVVQTLEFSRYGQMVSGRRDLALFAITAMNGDIGIAKFVFQIISSSPRIVFNNINVYAYSDPVLSLVAPGIQPDGAFQPFGISTAGTTTAKVAIYPVTTDGVGTIFVIPQGQTRYFVLRGDLTVNIAGSLTADLLGDGKSLPMGIFSTFYGVENKNNNFIWTDRPFVDMNSNSYFRNGYGVAGLPAGGISWVSTTANQLSGIPSVIVLQPNGGEIWTVGALQAIRWTSSNFPSDRKIDIVRLRDSYGKETNLLYGTINDGYEQIIVPSVPTGTYTLEIKTYSSNGELIFDASDRAFIVAEKSVIDFSLADIEVVPSIPYAFEDFVVYVTVKNQSNISIPAESAATAVLNICNIAEDQICDINSGSTKKVYSVGVAISPQSGKPWVGGSQTVMFFNADSFSSPPNQWNRLKFSAGTYKIVANVIDGNNSDPNPHNDIMTKTFSIMSAPGVLSGVGTIQFRATKDGVSWDSPPITVGLVFPDGIKKNIIVDPPQDSIMSAGVYTVKTTGLSGVTLAPEPISPSPTQTLVSGGTINFTVNYVTPQTQQQPSQISTNGQISQKLHYVPSSGSFYGIGSDNAIWKWDNSAKQWSRVTDGSIKDDFHFISESNIYAIGLDNQIWRWNGIRWSQESEGGKIQQKIWYVDGNHIYGIGTDNQVWRWGSAGGWTQITANGKIKDDFHFISESDIYGIGLDNQIWRWHGAPTSAWRQISSGGSISQKLHFNNPTSLYGIGTDNRIWLWSNGSWSAVHDSGQVKDDFVLEGVGAYVIGLDNQIWRLPRLALGSAKPRNDVLLANTLSAIENILNIISGMLRNFKK